MVQRLPLAIVSEIGATLVKPNIILIFVDDMPKWMGDYIPAIRGLYKEGVSLSEGRCTVPLCGPNRSVVWTGRYPHNTGITDNDSARDRFVSGGWIEKSMPHRLRKAGVVTGKFGKLINGMDIEEDYWPQMFDKWVVSEKGKKANFDVNVDGEVKSVDRSAHDENRYLGEQVRRFLRDRAGDEKPFYVELTPHDPHGPYYPAQQYRDKFPDFQWRPENYDFADPKHPAIITSQPPLSDAEKHDMDQENRGKLRELLSVGDMIQGVLDNVRGLGLQDDTYIFFLSDNGWASGELRLHRKGQPYESSLASPFVVIGPGVPKGQERTELAASIDLAPTFCALMGARTEGFEGRDLRSILKPVSVFNGTSIATRTRMLCEHPGQNWRALLTDDGFKYIERSDTNERELYDLLADPWEKSNIVDTGDPAAVEELHVELMSLASCTGSGCRLLED